MKYGKTLSMGGVLMLIFGSVSGCSSSEPISQSPVSEAVSWDVDETKVYGTITRPASDGVHPAVVFVAGSGPTDRDWNSPLLPGTNGSAKLLADALACEGFVTIRYDKRLSGPHVEENLPFLMGKVSLQSHLDELAGAVDLLLARQDVDPTHIFVLTSSEGAIHALNYQRQAKEKRFAGFVLTGAPGRTVSEVAKTQVMAILVSLPNSEELMALYDAAIAGFIAGRAVEPDPSLPEGVGMLLLSLSTPANLPFARELWETDISEWLQDISKPVLILIGKKDIQTDWQLDGGALEEAVKGQDNVTFNYPENASHALKYEEKSRDQLGPADGVTYNAEDWVLDPETLEAIQTWLASQR